MHRIHVAIALLLCSVSLPVLAQDKPADTMQIVREKIQADKKLLVATNMDLTEKEAQAFWPIYESYQKDLGLLNGRMLVLVQDYAKNYQAMTDEVAKRLVDEYLAIEQDRIKLKQSYRPKLRQALREKKVARYLQIENKVEAVIRYELAGKIPLVK
jgi:calcineurin-like phosphoesterase family protein